ncbi:MAG: S8 family peptidase [Bacteroidales bacterium]|nr:S8 family peptidase [Bacteroidales bacterium]
MTGLSIGIGLLLAAFGTASAQTALSAEARLFLSEWRMFQQKSAAPGYDSAFADLQRQYGLKTVPDAQAKSETLMLPVWVTFHSAEAMEQALQEAGALGFKVQTKLQTICTGLIPVNRLEALAAVDGVRQVQTGQRARLNLDESRKATRVDRLQDSNALVVPDVPSFRGDGVVIGIVDGGMEYVHPNFYDPDDAELLRIQRVWAQREKSGMPPVGYDYGAEYTSESAIERAGYARDNETHGTHTTGIAAGSGADTKFKGIAPKADLVLVPTTLVTEDILDGVNYIRNYAKAEEKPCVVNLSIGAHLGPHDGTSAFDRALDEMKAPGFVVVGAAGNEGNQSLYLGYDFQSPADTVFYTRLDFVSSQLAYVDLWSDDGRPVAVEVSVMQQSSGRVVDKTGFYPTTAPKDSVWTLLAGADGEVMVLMASEIDEFNGKARMLILVDARSMGRSFAVCLAVKAETDRPTRVQMWSNNGAFSAFDHSTFSPIVGGRTDHTVAEIGGTSNSILTVGSFNTKDSWITLSGTQNTKYASLLPMDSLSYFSSRGPRADGHVKPDIAAPGAMIVSSLNSHYNNPSDELVTMAYKSGRNYPFGVMMGTSMAAPTVAGIVALCLQVRPDWQIDSVLHYLSLTAINDGGTGEVRTNPDNGWGRGKIDALALVTAALQGVTDLPVEEIRQAVEGKRMLVYPNPNDGRFNVLLPEAGRAVRLQVVDRRGRVVYERGVQPAGSPVEMAVPGLKSGMYILQTDDGQAAKFIVR